MEAKKTRGGRRAGAGRKAKGKHGPRVLTISIRVSQDTKDKITFIGSRGWKLATLVEAKVNDVYDLINKGLFGEGSY